MNTHWFFPRFRPVGVLIALLVVPTLWGVSGCDRSEPAVKGPPQRPLRAMKSSIRRGQWDQAASFAEAVLENHPEDPETIALVAQVLYQNEQPDKAADLLVRACRVESFRDPRRVQQAMIALVGVGRFHEGLSMLEEAVAAQPMQHETRRWLFDFYTGSEQRQASIPHGRFLVRHRQFDLELLKALSNTERRTLENDPLAEMTERNPDDKRPLLGEAKYRFDLGELERSLEVLETITTAHPEFLPAQSLRGRVLAAARKLDELEDWASEQPDAIRDYHDYWLALGDWARAKEQNEAAARAYWEATRRDPDVMESWSKLATTLQTLASNGRTIRPEVFEAVQQRATLLSSFNQLKQRFERTGGISRAIVAEMVEALRSLGRLWEAEAWASIATTLPEDDSVEIAQLRQEIVAQLDKNTPWQLQRDRPEFAISLQQFGTPAISGLADSVPSVPQPESGQRPEVEHLALQDEARERGLDFFGRTADDLDQPGIMLYQTLGCGGGTLDYDLDGWSDLYLANAGGTPPAKDSDANALMRNLGGHFSPVTLPSGTGDRGFGQGVSVGDVNSDGFPDLLVLNYGPNQLLINNGDGTFREAADGVLAGNEWSTAASIADLDGDGLSDLVIVNYCAGLEPVTVTCPIKGRDDLRSCSPMKFPAEPDRFLQGTSEGRFVDRTEDWAASPTVLGRGLGVVTGQFDDRPGLDVLIANDMTNNHYWSRTADSDRFQLGESAMLRGLGGTDRSLAQGSMGIAAADMDNDADIDFYVTNFHNEYNTFHAQQSAGIWQDQTAQLRLVEPTMPMVGFGTEAIDLENDGVMELVVTNGHVDLFSRQDERALYAHPMQIFRRNDEGRYDSVAPWIGGGYLSRPHVGRGLWTIDADRDGLLDFAVTHQTEPLALLMNRSKPQGDWIAFQLVGRTASRDAVGAKLSLVMGETRVAGFQLSGDGYMCSNERGVRFAVPPETERCALEVTWPDGAVQRFDSLESGSLHLVIQGEPKPFRLN